jgi:hypothetical protein
MRTKEYDFQNAKRGAVVRTPSGKTRITIHVDTDTLNWFRNQVHKAGGGDYEELINVALREHTKSRDVKLEKTLRKIIREEMKAKPVGGKTRKKSVGKQSVFA